MQRLDLSLGDPALDLALDEALLTECDNGGPEVLRLWRPSRPFVALGWSRRVKDDVDEAACARLGVPVLRRVSGGGTVLQAPGCLNYALVLRLPENGPLASLAGTNASIMGRFRDALRGRFNAPLSVEGDTDLALDGKKVCGSAQRRLKRAILFHGAFLLDFDAGLMAAVLREPSRRPAYRGKRTHAAFLTRFPAADADLSGALADAWNASDAPFSPPTALARQLAASRYLRDEWNLKF